MKVRDLFEEWTLEPQHSNQRTSRSEYDWNQEAAGRQPKMNLVPQDVPEEWGLVDKKGKVVRRALTMRAASALQHRPDLIQKFGLIRPRKLA